MEDNNYDEYYASLSGPAEYGTHQASQRLRGPVRREQAQAYAYVTTQPGMRN